MRIKTVRITVYIVLFALFLVSLSTVSKVNAACAPGYTCAGTTVVDTYNGCNVFSTYCTQKWLYYQSVTCNSNCSWSHTFRNAKCENCKTVDGTITTNCCEGDGGGGDDSCFVAGTQITTSDGTKKNIEEIKPGDFILSYTEAGVQVPTKVLEVETPMRDFYYELVLTDGTYLKTTNEHPLFYKGSNYNGWASIDPIATYEDSKMEVGQIREKGYLLKEDGNWYKVLKIVKKDTPIKTYNLKKVEGYMNFYADGFLAHNKGEDPDPNDAPTAYFTAAPSPIKAGSASTYSATASDSDNNLSSMSLHRTRPDTQSWLGIGATVSCSGGSCSTSQTWTPGYSDIGNWALAVNAYDSDGAKCTGNWTVSSGWGDCDSSPTNGTTDSPSVCVYRCPLNDSSTSPTYYTKLRLTSPPNSTSVRIPTSTWASLSWSNIDFGATCGSTQSNTLNLHYRAVGDRRPAAIVGGIDPTRPYELQNLSPNTVYEWRISASNGQCSTESDWWSFRTNYDQPLSGWFTAIGGDVYGPNIRLKGPADGVAIGGNFGPVPVKLAYSGASVFSGGELSFSPSATMTATVGDALSAANTPLRPISSNWLESLNNLSKGSIIGSSEEKVNINSSNFSEIIDNLAPNKVYVIEDPLVFSGCPDPCTYDLTDAGVAVIYYLPGNSSNALQIPRNFKHATGGSSERVLFVSNANVLISKDINTAAPEKNSPANLEFGIVTSGNIIFEGTSNPLTAQDLPIVVEGPLIAGGIGFNRVTKHNTYPGTVVQYNLQYLNGLFSSVSSSNTNPLLFKGIFTSEVYWGDIK